MRNFSKTLISMAAVMAVGSAMAAGAMAAMTAEYADGYITISGIPTTYENTALTQHTLLVVQGTVNGETVDYVISDGSAEGTTCTIKQIDQDDSGAAFKKEGATDAVIYVGDLADGSYKVMVGNNAGSLDEDEFTVGEEEPEFETETIVLGNVNTNAILDAGDVLFVKRKAANKNRTDGVGNAGQTVEVKVIK